MYFDITIDTENILKVNKCGQPRSIWHARNSPVIQINVGGKYP